MTETLKVPELDLCFYDVMLTFKGERGQAAFDAVGGLLVEAGAVAGQYEPLDDRGVTALNYLILGTPDNRAVMADDEGRLANTTDIKDLLKRVTGPSGAQIVYVTKLTDEPHDIEEFADIEDADAARDLVFRQARSVAVGRVTQKWVRRFAAETGQDGHVLTMDGDEVMLVDGGLDISRLPTMDARSAFVYTTPLAMLVRIFLPGRSLGETVHEVNFTWFSTTTPLRTFDPSSETALHWESALRRLRSAEFLATELAQNPEATSPSDAVELWSSAADLAVVESVLTAAGLPGRAVRLTRHEGRAENLPGVTTVQASSPEVRDVAVDSPESGRAGGSSVVVVQEKTPVAAAARVAVFLAIAAVCLWLALGVFSGFLAGAMGVLSAIFVAVAAATGWKAYREFRGPRD